MTPAEIKALRRSLPSSGRRKHMSQDEFGRLLGLSGDDPSRTIRRIEHGDTEPTGPMLAVLTLLRHDPALAEVLRERTPA